MLSDVANPIIVLIAFFISIIVKPLTNKETKQTIGIIEKEKRAVSFCFIFKGLLKANNKTNGYKKNSYLLTTLIPAKKLDKYA